MASFTLQAFNAEVVTPNDSQDITIAGSPITGIENGVLLYVGTGGDLTITTIGGQTVTLVNIADGSYVPIQVKKVWATGTTANNLIALY
jgi:hypothetical protein